MNDPYTPSNAERAEWARLSLNKFTQLTFYDTFKQTCDTEGAETVMSDFVADLMHLCDEIDVDFDEVLCRAHNHYAEEVAEES